MTSPHRIDFWRLREIVRLSLYHTVAVESSIGGGWFVSRNPRYSDALNLAARK